MHRNVGRTRFLAYGLVLMLLLGSHRLSAGFSVGAEITPVLSWGLNAAYEYGPIRGEIGAHYFILGYLNTLMTEGGFREAGTIDAAYKGVLAAKFTPWENHAFYGGVGAFCELDREYDHYAVSVGPALQYSWKFPSRKLELGIDLLVPLYMFHDYEIDPENDLPSSAGMLGVLFLLMGPSIGISWTL